MFVIVLTYVKPLDEVDRHLDEHKAWVRRGFDEGVFVLAGRQKPRVGGALIALGDDRLAIEMRVAQDPFIANGVATAQIIEIVPSTVDERLKLLG